MTLVTLWGVCFSRVLSAVMLAADVGLRLSIALYHLLCV